MTIEEMRAQLGLGPDVPDAQVVEAWVQALYGLPDAEEPVSLAEARAQLNMLPDDPTDQDGMITGLITAARQAVEDETGLILTRRQVVEGAASFDALALSGWPVASVDAITYLDQDGQEQALPVDQYRVLIGRRNARVQPLVGGVLPRVADVGSDAITIVATAGYETPADVPDALRRAILVLVAEWFRNREDTAMPAGIANLCAKFRRYR